MLQKAAESLGAPEELLCLVETDEDERIARDGGFFCIGYLKSGADERASFRLSDSAGGLRGD